MMIRPVQPNDLETVRSLNEQALPHVNSITLTDFEEFIRISSFFMVVEVEANIVAFLIVVGPGKNYDSENYRYFTKEYDSFDYVDRIVVTPNYHGKKIGTALYRFLQNHTVQERITCEINIDPPNPGSSAFHAKLGFKEVGTQASEGRKKWVSLMVKELKKEHE